MLRLFGDSAGDGDLLDVLGGGNIASRYGAESLNGSNAQAMPQAVRACDVEAGEPVRWLEYGEIPVNEITLIAGSNFADWVKSHGLGYVPSVDIEAVMNSEQGVAWFASCWDEASVDFVERFKPPAYKIASASLTDDDLLRHHRQTGRPLILSTGMSTLEEMDHAVELAVAAEADVPINGGVSARFVIFRDAIGGSSVAVIVANLQVQTATTYQFFQEPIALGTIVFTSVFIVSGILTEYYGKAKAKQAVWLSFMAMILITF
jgi:hypothetical protein